MKFLIVNADDFGYSRGINRGTAEAHQRGVLTSTGLMVNTSATAEAVRMAADLPQRRQFDRFVELMGRLPTHIDGHQHVHRHPDRAPIFLALTQEFDLPLREYCAVFSVGGFYAQWEYGVSDPSHVSFDVLARILREEVPHGVTELGCHPGYYEPGFDCVYHLDREYELQTLCDSRLSDVLNEQGIRLIGYRDVPDALMQFTGSRSPYGNAEEGGRKNFPNYA